LGVVKLDSEGKCYLDKFTLDGYIKSGSTYLIRSKQYLELTSPIAHIKVDTYDKELWKNSELYELKGAIGLILFTDNSVEILNNKATKVMQSLSGDNYFQYVVHKNLIDVVGITKDILGECFQDGAANTWVKASYTTTENAIVKD